MKRTKGKTAATSRSFLILAVLLVAIPGFAQTSGTETVRTVRQILVSIPDRKLAVLEGDQIVGVFSVAVGANVSPSPAGEFQIVKRLSKPTYYHPGVVIPPGKDNPLGTRWIGLDKKGYGIHGTNVPSSIGKAASHGCIRLRNRDIEKLFEMVQKGDTVEILSDRDERTVAIFGGARETGTAVAQAQPAITAGAGQ